MLAAVLAAAAIWGPAPHTTWQWQLSGRLDVGARADVRRRPVRHPARVVAALHPAGRRVVCYLSAGSFEAAGRTRRVSRRRVGRPLDGWPDERWLDIRRARRARADHGAPARPVPRKGFDGVEADNVDGYTNRSGSR